MVDDIKDVGIRAQIQGLAGYISGSKKINKATNDINKSTQRLATQSQGVSKAFSGMATKLIAPILALGGLYVGARGLGGMIKTTADFEQSIVNAASVTGTSGQAFVDSVSRMSETALALASATKFTASEVGAAFYDLASKGFDVARLSAAQLEPILNLAAATATDLAFATELVTGTLRGFGLTFSESGRIADVFAKAVGSSAATTEKLRLSFGLIGGTAAAVNMPLEQTTAILATLYNRNIEASRAGTALSNVLTRLARGGARTAGDTLKELGVTADQLDPTVHKLTDIFRLLDERGISLRQSILLFGEETARTVLSLFQLDEQGRKVYDTIDDLEEVLNGAGGTAKQMADQQLDTLNGAMDLLKSKIESLIIRIIRELTPGLKEVTLGLGEMIEQFDTRPIIGFARDVASAFETIAYVHDNLDQVLATTAENVSLIWEVVQAQAKNFARDLILILEGLVEGARGAFWNLYVATLRIWNDIQNAIKQNVNKAIEPINALIEALSNVSSVLRLGEIDIRVPTFEIEDFVEPPKPGWFSGFLDEEQEAVVKGFEGMTDDLTQRWNEFLAKTERQGDLLAVLGIGDIFEQFRAGKEPSFAPTQKGVEEIERAIEDALRPQVAALGDDLLQTGQDGETGFGDAEAAVKRLKKQVNQIEDALEQAQAAMRGFADPRLTGMQAAEDELFELEMAIKRARLAELGMGEGAEEAAEIVKQAAQDMGDGFDILAAQQREIAEGIPVPFQKAMYEIEQAEREAARAADRTTTPGISATPEEEQSELDRLRRLREAKQLMFDLTYEPQLRSLQETFEDLTGLNEEITFAQAEKGLRESNREALFLEEALGHQLGQLERYEALLDDAETTTGAIGDTRAGMLGIEDKITSAYQEQETALKGQLEQAEKLNEALGRDFQQAIVIRAPQAFTGEGIDVDAYAQAARRAMDVLEAIDEAEERSRELEAILLRETGEYVIQRRELEMAEMASGNIEGQRLSLLGIERDVLGQYEQERTYLEEMLGLSEAINQSIANRPTPPVADVSRFDPSGIDMAAFTGIPGMAAGGQVTRGGVVEVGEKGRELAVLPTGTTVLPHQALQPANVSKSYSDTFNISGVEQTLDVMSEIRKWQQFQRILGGRR